MLLSRVANSLYWFGRYLERAENANRHLLVATDFAIELEGIQEKIALAEWKSLVASMPSASLKTSPKIPASPRAAHGYMISYLTDRENPYSVISSLTKARENARAVAETTTSELIYNLNQTYQTLTAIKPDQIADPGAAQEIATATHNSILTTLGAIENTFTRGEGWNYMKFGEAMERTQRTLFVLKTRLPNLAKWEENTDSPLYFASWRSLLRSVASQENYRQQYGPKFVPENVARFLIFHPRTPRSVNCGVLRMQGYMKGMPGDNKSNAEAKRILGKLAAQLEFDQEEIIKPANQVPFLEDSIKSIFHAHDLVSNPLRLN